MPETILASTCTRRVAKQTKVYDKACPGFYVSITPKGVAKFAFKFWDGTKQASVPIGVYHPEHLTVADARAKAFVLKGQAGAGKPIVQQAKAAKVTGITVNQVIDEYLAHIKTEIKKPDGEKRPRVEGWKEVERLLKANVRPAIGTDNVADVTKDQIAIIQNTVSARSVATARQTRSALNQVFKFAAEAGRSYITSSPCVYLPKLDTEHARKRVLTPAEIRTLWWGLDDPRLPACRSIALALKFMLATMLRSKEVRAAFRSNLIDFPKNPVLRIPLKYVKKRRVILQPLNSLATEIVHEAASVGNGDVIFASPRLGDEMLARSALNQALRNNTNESYIGIMEYLGIKHFTPHDLRRTAATLAGEEGCTEADIARCLDHQKATSADAVEAPSVTGRVYVQSARLTEKRAVLDKLDTALRRIIGKRPVVRHLKVAA